MAEETEKIVCCDSGSNALATAALMRGNNGDPAAMAAMMNNNNWMNNPFAYMMFMALFRNWNGFGDGNGVQGAETQAQLNAIRTQLQDNQNSSLLMDAVKGNAFAMSQLAQTLGTDFSSLQRSCCDIQAAVQQVAGMTGFSAERVINAANLGDLNIITQLKDCCCQTQQAILNAGYENRLANAAQTYTLSSGQRDLGSALTQGFSATAYATQQQTCDILNAGKDNTQRIIDTLNVHWSQDLQQRYNDARLELSQLRQNATLIAALKDSSTTGTTTTS